MKNYIVREGRMVIATTTTLDAALYAFTKTLKTDFESFGFDSEMRLTLERHDSRNGWHILILQTTKGVIDFDETGLPENSQGNMQEACMHAIRTVSELYSHHHSLRPWLEVFDC